MSFPLTEKRLAANRANAQKAGRKKGIARIESDKARTYIAERIGEYMPQIFDVLIQKAVVDRDINAIRELFDRGFGRAAQSVDLTSKGERINSLPEEAKKAVEDFEKNLRKNLK